MPVDLKRAEELYSWNRRFLMFGGLWPLEPAYLKFYISYAYFISHVVLSVADFINVFGNFSLMIANLLETCIQFMFGIKMMVLRNSGKLRKVLLRVKDGSNENNYRDDTEKELYLAYNFIARTFFKVGGYTGFATCFLYHFMPLKDIVIAVLQNETMPYVLPYRMHLFFDIPNSFIYGLLYLWQSPMFYYDYCHAMSIFFLCTLVVHVAGESAILAHRIRLIGTSSNPSDEPDDPEVAFRDIILKHYDIIWTATAIDDVFNAVLLEELVISTVLIGLTSYSILSADLSVSMYEVSFLANYTMSLLVVLLVYCLTGDYLIRESENIYDAYYQCFWYEMKPKYQKQLIICMARAQRPLQLTAGKFYIFSLPRFTDILKTAMAYISMLRAVV